MKPVVGILALLGIFASPVPAQHAAHVAHHPATAGGDTITDAFVARVRAATERYQDLSAAIADGFRRMGPDIPSLGEHWVNLARIATGGTTAVQPPVLIYVRVDGAPVLAGVAYTALLGAGDPYPDHPVPSRYWHEHNGNVDEEILPLNHRADARASPPASTRLAVAHAWIWIANPDGLWVADNPALERRRRSR